MTSGLEKQFGLAGKAVLVTGAGSGLGKAIASAVAQAGARVWCADLDGEAARETAGAIGPAARAAALDVRRADQVEEVVEAAFADQPLDVVFNNAGVNGPGVPLHEVAPEDWEDALSVNLGGVYRCTRAVVRRLVEAGAPGKIVNTASVWGSLGVAMRAMPAYAAAKGAVVNLTRELALEYAPAGITANAIAPIGFVTNIGGGATFRDPEVRRRLESKIPLGRLAQPSEIGGLAIFLASSASDFMTGSIVTIDGGFSAL